MGHFHSPRAVVVNAQSPPSSAREYDACASNLGEYCSLGPDGKPRAMSIGEKERMYLEAAVSYAAEGKGTLTDAEYDNLKEELTWQGSDIVFMTPDEQRFLAAVRMESPDCRLLSDDEFDALKDRLRKEGNSIASWGPRCSLRSRNVFADADLDNSLAAFLKLPLAALLLAVLFGGQVISDGSWGTVAEALAIVLAFAVSSLVVSVALQDSVVLRADCPICGSENRVVLGSVPFLAAGGDHAVVKCPQCTSKLKFAAQTRQVVAVPNDGGN
eukprot:CAMPEP_0117680276 /NCGR_PEP_ID=MMETSP0804-20121206/18263_1 /TAXON_ID=1074897 /ORGANISM="Tetraselmis astigmatica, Strain CCMP880" /LENGTH=270 /DNA_ID=CAMNT_0005489757 /DNA_START=645 /DNA_END=1457 /DNA_ORIENTATION=+